MAKKRSNLAHNKPFELANQYEDKHFEYTLQEITLMTDKENFPLLTYTWKQEKARWRDLKDGPQLSNWIFSKGKLKIKVEWEIEKRCFTLNINRPRNGQCMVTPQVVCSSTLR
ncbi:hypothetical protein LSTR_LSTR001743 [Laodelphax striatellus]|uniref:Uncharacterized protein n=1 Tax=Laodelphax striatellus TaxID=195883 RepID=A0A482XCR9_LAOST|nr:hypothetical protein LSTR_LSTR001743 [Laodelphax striatellus]